MLPQATSCHEYKVGIDGTTNAFLSRSARRQRKAFSGVLFSRRRKRMTILRAEVNDAKANTGRGIGKNAMHTKRKELTHKDVSKRLARLREDLKNTNNTGVSQPSEITVGTRFSEVRG